jgi:hypothetical protein
MSSLKISFKRLTGPILVFYLICAVVGTSMAFMTYWINYHSDFASPTNDTSDAFGKAIEAYQTAISMLTTLATGLLAALGFILINRPIQRYARLEFLWAAGSALCACVSLYWGYESSQNIVSAIEGPGPLTVEMPILQHPREFQFYSMLLGVILVAHFMIRTLIKVNTGEGAKNATTR